MTLPETPDAVRLRAEAEKPMTEELQAPRNGVMLPGSFTITTAAAPRARPHSKDAEINIRIKPRKFAANPLPSNILRASPFRSIFYADQAGSACPNSSGMNMLAANAKKNEGWIRSESSAKRSPSTSALLRDGAGRRWLVGSRHSRGRGIGSFLLRK